LGYVVVELLVSPLELLQLPAGFIYLRLQLVALQIVLSVVTTQLLGGYLLAVLLLLQTRLLLLAILYLLQVLLLQAGEDFNQLLGVIEQDFFIVKVCWNVDFVFFQELVKDEFPLVICEVLALLVLGWSLCMLLLRLWNVGAVPMLTFLFSHLPAEHALEVIFTLIVHSVFPVLDPPVLNFFNFSVLFRLDILSPNFVFTLENVEQEILMSGEVVEFSLVLVNITAK
jgi:hypothetical protein